MHHYVWLKILRDDGNLDREKYGRMTEPIAAFAWIDERLLPHFDRQEAKRVKAVRPRYRQP